MRRWVGLFRDLDHVLPLKKRGDTRSDVSVKELEAILDKHPDANAGEITTAYNVGRRGEARRRASSIKRALHRSLRVRLRALEQLRPDVAAKREVFVRTFA